MLEFWIDFFSLDLTRPVEGFWSWQHLTVITLTMTIAFILAFSLGKRTKGQLSKQLQVLKITAVLLVGMEITRDTVLWIMYQRALILLEQFPYIFLGFQLFSYLLELFLKESYKKRPLIWFLCLVL